MDINKVYFEAKNENEKAVLHAILKIKYKLHVGIKNASNMTYPLVYIADGCINGGKVHHLTIKTRTLVTTEDLVDFALRGFKNPWEVAPDGKKIVPMEDRKEYTYPTDCEVLYCDGDTWLNSTNTIGWSDPTGTTVKSFAVPIGYEFKKPVKKMTAYKHIRYFFCLQQPTVIRESDNMFRRDDNGGLYSFGTIKLALDTGVVIEVTADDLPYLKRPDVEKYGETELRIPLRGDKIVPNLGKLGHGEIATAKRDVVEGTGSHLHGYFWCKTSKNGFEKWWNDRCNKVNYIDYGDYDLSKEAYEAGAASK